MHSCSSGRMESSVLNNCHPTMWVGICIVSRHEDRRTECSVLQASMYKQACTSKGVCSNTIFCLQECWSEHVVGASVLERACLRESVEASML